MTIIRQGTSSPLTGMVGAIVIVQFNGTTYMRKGPSAPKGLMDPQPVATQAAL